MSSVTKLEAVESQLEAAAFLMLRTFQPEPIHTLISASRGILYDLSKKAGKTLLDKWDQSVLRLVFKTDKLGDIRFYQNYASNFLKHANRDAELSLRTDGLAVWNKVDLQLCLLALGDLGRETSFRLQLVFLYLCLLDGSIIPADLFEKILGKTPTEAQVELEVKDAIELKHVCLTAFEMVA